MEALGFCQPKDVSPKKNADCLCLDTDDSNRKNEQNSAIDPNLKWFANVKKSDDDVNIDTYNQCVDSALHCTNLPIEPNSKFICNGTDRDVNFQTDLSINIPKAITSENYDLDNSTSKVSDLSPNSGGLRSKMRPSLECMVARLHNRADETKSENTISISKGVCQFSSHAIMIADENIENAKLDRGLELIRHVDRCHEVCDQSFDSHLQQVSLASDNVQHKLTIDKCSKVVQSSVQSTDSCKQLVVEKTDFGMSLEQEYGRRSDVSNKLSCISNSDKNKCNSEKLNDFEIKSKDEDSDSNSIICLYDANSSIILTNKVTDGDKDVKNKGHQCRGSISSSSGTPLFYDSPSDGSQSEMMVKISDAVEALLSQNSDDGSSCNKVVELQEKSREVFDLKVSKQLDTSFSSVFKHLDSCHISDTKLGHILCEDSSVVNDGCDSINTPITNCYKIINPTIVAETDGDNDTCSTSINLSKKNVESLLKYSDNDAKLTLKNGFFNHRLKISREEASIIEKKSKNDEVHEYDGKLQKKSSIPNSMKKQETEIDSHHCIEAASSGMYTGSNLNSSHISINSNEILLAADYSDNNENAFKSEQCKSHSLTDISKCIIETSACSTDACIKIDSNSFRESVKNCNTKILDETFKSDFIHEPVDVIYDKTDMKTIKKNSYGSDVDNNKLLKSDHNASIITKYAAIEIETSASEDICDTILKHKMNVNQISNINRSISLNVKDSTTSSTDKTISIENFQYPCTSNSVSSVADSLLPIVADCTIKSVSDLIETPILIINSDNDVTVSKNLKSKVCSEIYSKPKEICSLGSIIEKVLTNKTKRKISYSNEEFVTNLIYEDILGPVLRAVYSNIANKNVQEGEILSNAIEKSCSPKRNQIDVIPNSKDAMVSSVPNKDHVLTCFLEGVSSCIVQDTVIQHNVSLTPVQDTDSALSSASSNHCRDSILLNSVDDNGYSNTIEDRSISAEFHHIDSSDPFHGSISSNTCHEVTYTNLQNTCASSDHVKDIFDSCAISDTAYLSCSVQDSVSLSALNQYGICSDPVSITPVQYNLSSDSISASSIQSNFSVGYVPLQDNNSSNCVLEDCNSGLIEESVSPYTVDCVSPDILQDSVSLDHIPETKNVTIDKSEGMINFAINENSCCNLSSLKNSALKIEESNTVEHYYTPSTSVIKIISDDIPNVKVEAAALYVDKEATIPSFSKGLSNEKINSESNENFSKMRHYDEDKVSSNLILKAINNASSSKIDMIHFDDLPVIHPDEKIDDTCLKNIRSDAFDNVKNDVNSENNITIQHLFNQIFENHGGNCKLCGLLIDEDLDMHVAQKHSCITYIPALISRAFHHHMQERIKDVSTRYNDNLYGNPTYICKTCNSIFKTMGSVRQHINEHQDIYSVQLSEDSSCDICENDCCTYPQYKWRKLLKQSIYHCYFCQFKFSCESSLVTHLHICHMNDGKCTICQKLINATDKEQLLEHNEIHNDGQIPEIMKLMKSEQSSYCDQSKMSWNALNNYLNYLDGKSFRLNTVNENKEYFTDRGHISFPLKVHQEFAVTPDSFNLSPATDMVKYMKGKLTACNTGQKVDSYASTGFDFSVQILLQQNLKTNKKKRKKITRSNQSKKQPIASNRMTRGSISSDLSLCRIHGSRKKSKGQSGNGRGASRTTRQSRKKEVRKTSSLSRTRSGMKPNESHEESDEEELSSPGSIEVNVNENSAIVTGEWVNSHTFVCCSCGSVFLNLAEIMDHKWMAHPWVWCAHTMMLGQNYVPKVFRKQYLPANTDISDSSILTTKKDGSDLSCNQCKVKFSQIDKFHEHLIECGGLNLVVNSKKRSKRGLTRFKRRRGQGIPSSRYSTSSSVLTPNKAPSSGTSTPARKNRTTEKSQKCVKRRLKLVAGSIGNSSLKNKFDKIVSRSSTRIGVFSHKSGNIRMKLRRKNQSKISSARISKSKVILSPLKNIDTKKTKHHPQSRRKSSLTTTEVHKDDNQPQLTNELTKLFDGSQSSSKNNRKIKKELMPPSKKSKVNNKSKADNKLKEKIVKLAPVVQENDAIIVEQETFDTIDDCALTNNVLNKLNKSSNIDPAIVVNEFKKVKSSPTVVSQAPPVRLKRKVRTIDSSRILADANFRDDSDSSSEPEVTSNFRRKINSARVGLRNRASIVPPRYSLRPASSNFIIDNSSPTNLDNGDPMLNENASPLPNKVKDIDSGEISQVKKLRKYNIGDDDDSDTSKSSLLRNLSDGEAFVTNSKSDIIDMPENRNIEIEVDSRTESIDNRIGSNQNHCCKRKSTHPIKATNRVKRLCQFAQRKFSRLKLGCYNNNTDSESSGIEGFRSQARPYLSFIGKKSKRLHKSSKIESVASHNNAEETLSVNNPSFSVDKVSIDLTPCKDLTVKNLDSAKRGRCRKRRKPITPKIVVSSDSESELSECLKNLIDCSKINNTEKKDIIDSLQANKHDSNFIVTKSEKINRLSTEFESNHLSDVDDTAKDELLNSPKNVSFIEERKKFSRKNTFIKRKKNITMISSNSDSEQVELDKQDDRYEVSVTSKQNIAGTQQINVIENENESDSFRSSQMMLGDKSILLNSVRESADGNNEHFYKDLPIAHDTRVKKLVKSIKTKNVHRKRRKILTPVTVPTDSESEQSRDFKLIENEIVAKNSLHNSAVEKESVKSVEAENLLNIHQRRLTDNAPKCESNFISEVVSIALSDPRKRLDGSNEDIPINSSVPSSTKKSRRRKINKTSTVLSSDSKSEECKMNNSFKLNAAIIQPQNNSELSKKCHPFFRSLSDTEENLYAKKASAKNEQEVKETVTNYIKVSPMSSDKNPQFMSIDSKSTSSGNSSEKLKLISINDENTVIITIDEGIPAAEKNASTSLENESVIDQVTLTDVKEKNASPSSFASRRSIRISESSVRVKTVYSSDDEENVNYEQSSISLSDTDNRTPLKHPEMEFSQVKRKETVTALNILSISPFETAAINDVERRDIVRDTTGLVPQCTINSSLDSQQYPADCSTNQIVSPKKNNKHGKRKVKKKRVRKLRVRNKSIVKRRKLSFAEIIDDSPTSEQVDSNSQFSSTCEYNMHNKLTKTDIVKKSKQKYSFKQKSGDDQPHSVTFPADEVKVLSYKSLNTNEHSISKSSPSKSEINISDNEEAQESKDKQGDGLSNCRSRKRVRLQLDENSPVLDVASKEPRRKIFSRIDDSSVTFACSDCGLSFDSSFSREDHRQDCLNIAFEMSLMAEDHLFECPYCQLTFALKGTQRQHVNSCRARRSRKTTKKKRSRRINSLKKSLVVPPPPPEAVVLNDNKNNLNEVADAPTPIVSESSPIEAPVENLCDEEPERNRLDDSELTTDASLTQVSSVSNSPKMTDIAMRLYTSCLDRPELNAICALSYHHKLCSTEIRRSLAASTTTLQPYTVIQVQPTSSSGTSGSLKLFEDIVHHSSWINLPSIFEIGFKNFFKSEIPKEFLMKDSKTNQICITISRPLLLRALCSLEDFLREAEDVQNLSKKQKMLHSMKETFQAGTGS